ncbi:hypothetical protein [Nonomuraea sp. NPDC049129]|uniref:hypothetical protein n=1 Tax=Nonomuraea sp. NPDC049129 TaxID=3155272 RepID=UPI0034042476
MADKLPEIPAAAKAEVDRNLALLETQIQEANNRLANSAGQGGPNFVRNAILSPLASKRCATPDRIAIAIGRVAGNAARRSIQSRAMMRRRLEGAIHWMKRRPNACTSAMVGRMRCS